MSLDNLSILAFIIFVIFILRLFKNTGDISEIKKLLEKQNEILEKQNVYGVYSLEDIVKEIRDLGKNSDQTYNLTDTIENIEKHLKEIERYAEKTDANICQLRNDYHYRYYYKKGCYDEYCVVCKDLKETEEFNKEFPPRQLEEDID